MTSPGESSTTSASHSTVPPSGDEAVQCDRVPPVARTLCRWAVNSGSRSRSRQNAYTSRGGFAIVIAAVSRSGRLPEFTAHLQSVRATGGTRSHWTASSPLGGTVEWDAEVVEDSPGEVIAWRSVGRTVVPNRGAVRFTDAPGGRGTEVRVEMEYLVPGGRAGATVARLLGDDPHQQVEDDLRRAKQVLETGDVVRSDGSPGGPDARRQLRQHPGHPVGAGR